MIAGIMGGPQILESDIQGEFDLEEAVRQGIPAQAVRNVATSTGATLQVLQDVMGIDRSTFARRIRTHARLKAAESDRLVRVARIAALAIEALGAADAIAWLNEPNYALGERVPLNLLETEVGARQVEQVIGRIEHGVFS